MPSSATTARGQPGGRPQHSGYTLGLNGVVAAANVAYALG